MKLPEGICPTWEKGHGQEMHLCRHTALALALGMGGGARWQLCLSDAGEGTS